MKKKLPIKIATIVTLYFAVSIVSSLDKQVMIIVSQIYECFFFNLGLLLANIAANGDAKFHFEFSVSLA